VPLEHKQERAGVGFELRVSIGGEHHEKVRSSPDVLENDELEISIGTPLIVEEHIKAVVSQVLRDG